MPFGQRIASRQVLFRHDLIHKKKDQIVKEVASVILSDSTDVWTIQTDATLKKLNLDSLQLIRKGSLRSKLKILYITENLTRKASMTSLRWMPDPIKWFSLQSHVNDSNEFRALSRFRAGDAGLGNRRPNVHGRTYKQCPWCNTLGLLVDLNEFHVGVECPGVGFVRPAVGISHYLESRSVDSLPLGMIFKDYLGGDGANAQTMGARASSLNSILDNWLTIVTDL